MLSFEGDTADETWRQAFRAVRESGELTEGRDQPTRELLHTSFTIRQPRNRLVFALPINPAFCVVEAIWTLAGRNDAAFLRPWNRRMDRWSDDGKTFHGSYGNRLRKHFGFDQLVGAMEALKANPQSRQIVLQFWDGRKDLPTTIARSRDIPCNVASHLLLRGGRLEWLQIMRSNDLVWGSPTNFFQFTILQEIMAGWLAVDVGSYNHVSDSLHIYRRHWDLLETLRVEFPATLPLNGADLRLPISRWERVWKKLESVAAELAVADNLESVERAATWGKNLPAAYRQWTSLLSAERARRIGEAAAALDLIGGAGAYWATSWKLWNDSKTRPSSRVIGDAVPLPPQLRVEV